MSKALKEELDEKNYNTLETKKQRADTIKAEKERRK